MSNSLEEAKRKKKNRNRFIILLVIYFMVIAVFAAAGSANLQGYILLICIGVITVIYWVAFGIIIRRENQKYKIKGKKKDEE